jgi:mannose-6-phosphate isomerase-like protein (cupin superfamily)
MQRHDETDEVFVLLAGRCILFIGDGKEEAGEIAAVELEPGKVYNVKRGTWHTHTLTEDAKVLVVENRDTTVENSPFCPLSPEQTDDLVAATRRLWGPAPA